ncbi:probable proline--tRNA ligase, mitochondrial [Plutella xylostella]|uniref:probable proline--tRNA ligase, mitochondrial n=1 Tax=Plutella xylostella TaxID=51655 RepID=UPI0020321F51|nr:probable proline--tRNA ligase, mitochondrial [Plutella xylostella]
MKSNIKMRLLSKVFQPLITIPKNAKIKSTEVTCKSQKLLLECGLIRPTSSGLFAILPLAQRAMDKLERHICKHIEAAGAQRISLSSLTPASLWDKSGRLQEMGPELMKATDRHGKQYVLAPTHEEAITDLLADVGPLSYKQLPLILYQISSKFRDEHRPKHGLLRARHFTMMDAYSHHASEDCVLNTYERISRAYRDIFEGLGLKVYRVEAPSGAMGGSLSHEWQAVAEAGEDSLTICQRCQHAGLEAKCPRCGGEGEVVSSIEVGHTFVLNTRYSSPLGACYTDAQGARPPLRAACYGVGGSRLLAACVEAGGRWPRGVAPYSALLVPPKEGSKEWQQLGWSAVEQVYSQLSVLPTLRDDVIVDDRCDMTIGKRLMQANRMGYPYVVVMGKAALESPPRYELVCESSTQLLTMPELLKTIDTIDHGNMAAEKVTA